MQRLDCGTPLPSVAGGILVGLTLLICCAGCGSGGSSDHHAGISPAKVAHPVSEEKLNTIELTEDAVRRLGIETAPIAQKTIRRMRQYGAELVLPTHASIIVSAPVTGTVRTVPGKDFPEPGRLVAARSVLLELAPLLSPERDVLTPAERIRFVEAKNAVAQARIDAEAQVQQAQVQVDAAEIALARAERLFNEQAGTARAVDDARAQLQLAQKTLDGALNRKQLVEGIDLTGAEAGAVRPLPIEAPMTGQVRSILVRSQEIVAIGTPLFEVMNDSTLWVKVPVYAGDLDDVDLTAAAELTPLDGRPAEKTVIATPADLPPTAVPLAAAIDLYYEVANPVHEFRPGQRLTAHLTLKSSRESDTFPWSAVIHDIYGGQWVFEQIEPAKFVRRRVEVEWVQDGTAILRRGPAAGTLVVTAGAAELAGTEFGFSK